MKKLAVLTLMALMPAALWAPALAQSFGPAATPKFTVTETGHTYFTLQEAVHAIGAGRGTIRIAPGTYEECVLQTQGTITYRAAEPGAVIFDSVPCEQKAAFVLRGEAARVEGIVFQNIVTPDGNGAGIRVEAGDLSVTRATFRDSQSGIVAGDDADGAISVERSTFTGLGRCNAAGNCAHALYVGHYGSLAVTASRFEQGRGGHYLKSRAPRIQVADSSFDDSAGQATNYMIDLADGATGAVAGNAFVQGRSKENSSAFIALASESRGQPSDGLSIAGNDAALVPGLHRRTRFVMDRSGAALALSGNRLDRQIAEIDRPS